MQRAAYARGIDISQQKARQVTVNDIEVFDFIIAMDTDNKRNVMKLAAPEQQRKIRLLSEFAKSKAPVDVPDPYYGGEHGFEQCLDIIDAGIQGLLQQLEEGNL